MISFYKDELIFESDPILESHSVFAANAGVEARRAPVDDFDLDKVLASYPILESEGYTTKGECKQCSRGGRRFDPNFGYKPVDGRPDPVEKRGKGKPGKRVRGGRIWGADLTHSGKALTRFPTPSEMSWLPEGCRVESKTRMNGATVGIVDKVINFTLCLVLIEV